MVIERKFPRYPNYSFLQLEEINQTIYNYCRLAFYKWYCIDLSKIVNKYSVLGNDSGINHSFKNIRYDFAIISCNIIDNEYIYTFEIRNTLWTGKWKLTTLTGEEVPKENYTVTSDNTNGNTLTVTGTGLNMFKFCLELSNEDKSRNIELNELIIQFEKEYEFTHQFDTSTYEEIKVINSKSGKPISNATVNLIPLDDKREYVDKSLENKSDYPYLKSYTTTTNDKGIARILFDKTKTPSVYYARLEATLNNSHCYIGVTDNRVQNYTRKVDTDSELTMYKGEIKEFTFNITPINKYGIGYKPQSEKYQVDIYHTYDSAQSVPLVKVNTEKLKTETQTVFTDENGDFTFKINGREFYGDYSKVKFVLPETTKFDSVTSDDFIIHHEWLYANDFNHLKQVCEDENGADAIVLRNKTYNHHSKTSVNINRKQYVLGAKGNTFATIDSSYYAPVFVVNKGANTSRELMNMLVLNGIKVQKAKSVIKQYGNSYVQILNCVFTENKAESYIGSVLYQTDKTCVANINHNYFVNNYGNNIKANGNVEIDNNLFKVTDVKYTYQPEPVVLEQYTGTGVLKNNQIYINTSIDYSTGKAKLKAFSKNRSYAKASIWVGKTAKVNGKGVSELGRDNSLNFFNAPYNNRAYIFSIYYYPYSNVKTYIVAFATGDRINKAIGHAVEGINWCWKNGYNLVREESKQYSTANPFVTIKNGKAVESTAIYVPTGGGVV